jgi:hypothetical protein
MKLSSLCSLCVYLFTLMTATAQPAGREIADQSLEWFSITSNIQVSSKVTLMVEGQFRYAGTFQPSQNQARTALEIKLNDHLSIVPIAYVYTWNYRYGKQPAGFENHEHRIWHQVFYKHAWRKLRMDHRLRFEHRFIQSRTMDGGGDVAYNGYDNRQFRIRYRFMTRLPINNSEIGPRTWFLGFYDEVFISWGKSVTFHEPDQNRLFAGPGYQVDGKLSVLPGFLYQMLIKENGAKQENNLGVQVMFTYNFTLNKE